MRKLLINMAALLQMLAKQHGKTITVYASPDGTMTVTVMDEEKTVDLTRYEADWEERTIFRYK